MVHSAMPVAPPQVCVLMAGLSRVPWLLMHHRCAAPPSQSPISLTQARWGCKPAINSTHSTYTLHISNTKLRLGRIPSLAFPPPPPSKQTEKKTHTGLSTGLPYLQKTWTLFRIAIPKQKINNPRNPTTSTPPQCHTPTPPSPSVPETGGLGLLLQLAEVSLG